MWPVSKAEKCHRPRERCDEITHVTIKLIEDKSCVFYVHGQGLRNPGSKTGYIGEVRRHQEPLS